MYHIGMFGRHPSLPDPSQISKEGLDFLKQCFQKANLRPTVKQLLEHPFVADVSKRMNAKPNVRASRPITQHLRSRSSMEEVQHLPIIKHKNFGNTVGNTLVAMSPSVSSNATSSGSKSTLISDTNIRPVSESE